MRLPRLTAVLAASTLLLLFSACDQLPSEESSSDSEIKSQVEAVLGSQVTALQIREIDVAELSEQLQAGEATVPIATPDMSIVELNLVAAPANLRPDSVDEGLLRQGPEAAERVPLPPEASFFVGACTNNESTMPCGGLTVLDQDQTMVRGMVKHSDFGISFIQSANHLLETDQYPNQHVIYNIEHTEPPQFLDSESPRPDTPEGSAAKIGAKVDGETSVVLDGDVEFYDINPNTVWRRQESLLLAVQLTTELLEPNTSGTWTLELDVAGQEVWTSGGPSTDNGDDLIDTLEDPGYYLINSLSDEQMHLFLLGYDVASEEEGGLNYGLLGKAGGIGHKRNGGWGEWSEDPQDVTDNHLLSEARSGQSWYLKATTLTHETGHLIGGLHPKAVTNGCSGSACGRSIMNGQANGNEEFFFSDDNDQRIDQVIDNTLP